MSRLDAKELSPGTERPAARPARTRPRYENDVMRVRQMSLEPSLPMYSLTDQKVVPSAGSTTVLL